VGGAGEPGGDRRLDRRLRPLRRFWISHLAILFGHEPNAERERSLELGEGRPRAEREVQLEPRDEPKQTGRNLVLLLIGASAAGAAAFLATNEDFRNQVRGSAKAPGEEITGGSEAR